MAYKTKDMSAIKQVILRHLQGESNRSIAKSLSMSKNTVNRYISLAEADSMPLRQLVELEDETLDFRFNGGSPAYTDERFKDFLGRLPYFEEQMRHKHMTLQQLWEEYRLEVPDGYGISQFRYHYRQNAVALKGKVATVLKDLHQGGDMLYLDFAGDPMGYVDRETGELVKVQVFVGVLAASDYTFAMAVPSQRTEDFCYAVDCCLQALGGVPRQLVPDNLKAAVIKADRYNPTLNKAFEQLGNHYGCVINPARALHPKDKALVENAQKPDEEDRASEEISDGRRVRRDGFKKRGELHVAEEPVEPEEHVHREIHDEWRRYQAEKGRRHVGRRPHSPFSRRDARDAGEDGRDESGEHGEHRRRSDYPVVHLRRHVREHRHPKVEKRDAEERVCEHQPGVH